MKKLIGLSVVAISLFASSGYEVGIGAGRTEHLTKSPIEHYNFLNLRVGKFLNKNSLVRFDYERSQRIMNRKSWLQRALLNYEYDIKTKSIFTPYAFIGGGYQWVSGTYKDSYVANFGIGSKFKLSKNLQWFAEIRGLRDFRNDDNHYSGLLGIVYNFGGNNNENVVQPQPQPAPQPVKPVQEVKPVPKPKPVVIDSDHDGVPDNIDKCPNTPAGVKVDKFGCPIDSDGDGVPDYLDKCPNTPKGVHVDKYGCPVTFNFDVQFKCSSAKIEPQYMEEIKKFAEFLKENPAYKVELDGYTDNTGSKTYNIILSQKRAKAVYDALIKLGISKDRLKWVGFGAANPIAPNDTPEGRAKNRRVVAKLYF
jgi:OOP family OmpA-OmpF porin